MRKTPLQVFISYKWESEAHKEWVKKFATDLRVAGIDAKLDRWEVRLGDSFTDYMTSKINEADAVLFIMTTKSVAAAEAPKGEGGAVKFEIQMATSRRIAGEKMRLIGIFREGEVAPAHLRDHRYADFRNDAEYQNRLKELIDDLLGKDSQPPLGTRSDPSGAIIISYQDMGLGGDLELFISEHSSFNSIVYEAYHVMDDYIEPNAYGKTWVLKDKETGKVFDDPVLVNAVDKRSENQRKVTLEEAGIKAGMNLEVIYLVDLPEVDQELIKEIKPKG
jgi:TIR domain